ncbi:tyrosine-type recombinase/integrase [Actinoallomurus sp. CA-150999]|uniref:tyrosine-type recombinase/integrase n=1 Tax=Actinoallomurus sp. CA-150999 TaxID=3239887 RepID=UPI003D9502CA
MSRQLRHAHATELINAGVSIGAVRRCLGQASTQTTQFYAELDDEIDSMWVSGVCGLELM